MIIIFAVTLIASFLFGSAAYGMCRADERSFPVPASDDDYENSPNVYGDEE